MCHARLIVSIYVCYAERRGGRLIDLQNTHPCTNSSPGTVSPTPSRISVDFSLVIIEHRYFVRQVYTSVL